MCRGTQYIFKKPKTKDKHIENSTTTSISSFVEHYMSAAKESTEHYLKTRKTFESTATIRTENNNIQTRKFEFSRVVVNGLTPYYKNNFFATKGLFQFMAKSIGNKLLESTIGHGESVYLIRFNLRTNEYYFQNSS